MKLMDAREEAEVSRVHGREDSVSKRQAEARRALEERQKV